MGKIHKDQSFGLLFKKFRLRSQIETLSQFGDLLAEEGLVYENSLYTRWQNGERMPRDRRVILKISHLFLKRGGMRAMDEVNSLLASVELRDVNEDEKPQIEILIKKGGVSVNELVEYQNVVDSDQSQIIMLPFDLLNRFITTILDSTIVSQLFLILRIPRVTTFRIKVNNSVSALSGYYLAMLIWWIFIHIYNTQNSSFNIAFSFAFGLIPLLGGTMGIISSQKWVVTKAL